jgi:lipopolysaccharide transport protein LptA
LTRGERILTGETGRFFSLADRFVVQGDARLWEQESFIRAAQMVFHPQKGTGEAEGQVESFLAAASGARIQGPGQEPGLTPSREPVVVHSDQMTFDESARQVEYSGHAQAQQGKWRLKADKIVAELSPDGSSLQKLHGSSNVEMTDGDMTAQGDDLDYDQQTHSGVLSADEGKTARVIQGNRSTRGERIVFHLDEQQYSVEGGESVFLPEPRGAKKDRKPAPPGGGSATKEGLGREEPSGN